MAVYTAVSAEKLAVFLKHYDAGTLRSFKGIAEGVENSNYLVDTDQNRFILTLYEKRVDRADLPFFMALLDHLADKGLPVPRAITDRGGRHIRELENRAACLIEFLDGVSVSHPIPAQARATGEALAEMHRAAADFTDTRANTMGKPSWHKLAQDCGAALRDIAPDLPGLVESELEFLDAHWPADLPRSVIHADLFPDNVLMTGNKVSGLIDFYFSCSEITAYDLAVAHASWCFDGEGRNFDAAISRALIAGYRGSVTQTAAEIAALPVLARGAALRFTLTRAYDWINTPPGAMVTRKDPMAFARRLQFYRAPEHAGVFA